MMKNYRSTIVGFATLVVLLTAGAAQSLAGSNTVFSDDIVDGQVAYADIRNNAMTGAKILDNSITGADVNESTLGLTCPSGTSRVGDGCFTSVRVLTTLVNALNDCIDEGLRLPSISEARMVQEAGNSDTGIWTDNYYPATPGDVSKALVVNNAEQDPHVVPAADEWNYRCVTTVGARP